MLFDYPERNRLTRNLRWVWRTPKHNNIRSHNTSLICLWYIYIHIYIYIYIYIWVRSRNCGCLVTWFCYQLIAKPGNKTGTDSWPDPYMCVCNKNDKIMWVPFWMHGQLYIYIYIYLVNTFEILHASKPWIRVKTSKPCVNVEWCLRLVICFGPNAVPFWEPWMWFYFNVQKFFKAYAIVKEI